MIEKLPTSAPFGVQDDWRRKINELVDVVNLLQCKNVHIESDLQDLMYPKEIKGELGENTTNSKMEDVQDEMPRCPFCGEELYYAQEIDGGFDILTCNCSAGLWLFGNDKMWHNLEKVITELDRTRKALEVAVDALKKYTDASGNWWYGYEFQGHYEDYAGEYADKALEQITAMEQKDKQ